MEAITREEKIMSGENLTPITRKEMFLAKAAGMDVETPAPITREEMFLSKIVGGGSGGGSGIIDVTELPTENIDPNAIYKVTDTGEMYMYGTTARLMVRAINDDTDTVVDFVEQGLLPVHDIHYLIVDEMPSIAYTIFAQNGIGVMYILRETGEPWFMFDGQIANFADAFNSSGDMPWLGMTSNASAETEPGVYTEMVSGWNKIRVFTESVKSA